ncbi:MAG: DNA cytosine methyltransferase [Pirellula sp.]|jgi:DNA (cytosine-5)-methyltransferase 1
MKNPAQNPIPVLSLFSGAGGLDYGFSQAGFHTVLAIDNDRAATETFNRNFGGNVARNEDLSTLPPEAICKWLKRIGTKPRGIIGGPPCQGFSIGNTTAHPDDPRNQLAFRYCDILDSLSQKFSIEFFVFENVLGLRSPKHRSRLATIIARLQKAGFQVAQAEINALRFGVAQNRRRLFLVGINRSIHGDVEFGWPLGTNNVRTVRSVIHGMPDPAYRANGMIPDQIDYHPNHWTSRPCSLKFLSQNFGDGRSFRRLAWDEPSWTVAYGNREIHIHPDGKRRLSVLEAMRLQSFPGRFVITGSFSQQVTQVSNAVPPRVARAIASAIYKQLFSQRDGR